MLTILHTLPILHYAILITAHYTALPIQFLVPDYMWILINKRLPRYPGRDS